MIALALLILINLWILQTTREPQVLVEVKQRYRTLREHIASTKNEKYTMLTKTVPITGMKRMNYRVIFGSPELIKYEKSGLNSC